VQDAVALLDIGTSKVASIIVAVPRAAASLDDVRVLGAGLAPSRGLRDGRIVALDAAEEAVRAAVAEAEAAAGMTVGGVVLAVASSGLKLHTLNADTRIEGRVVAAADTERMLRAARSYAEREGRALLHVACHTYRLDGAAGIANPQGLAGRRLGAELDAVTGDAAQVSNLLRVLERAHLHAACLAPAPYASALATTTAEERNRGVIAADLGAGGSAFAVFAEGRLLAIGRVPIGGDHATLDLARQLSLSNREAERIKKECGIVAQAAVGADAGMDVEGIAASPSGGGIVGSIVRDRLLDLLGRIAEAVAQRDFAPCAIECAVLSGGASQQAGLRELARDLLGLAVRSARIEPLTEMPADLDSPAFSTVVGLAQVALDPAIGVRLHRRPTRGGGYLRRMGQWLQESF
jgi:cell division protein FtsA